VNGFASMAHGPDAATPVFNANFYIVAATVIPVLWLALTIQGSIFDRALRAYHVAARQGLFPEPGQRAPAPLALAFATVVRMILTILTISGILGEILAIYALYQQQANSSTRQLVLQSAIILTAATIAGPTIANAIAYGAARKPPTPRRTRPRPKRRSPARPLTPKWAKQPRPETVGMSQTADRSPECQRPARASWQP
jgi:hypothetical protein